MRIVWSLIITAFLFLAACGGEEAEQDGGADGATTSGDVSEPDTSMARPEEEAAPVLYPEGRLDPSLVDPGTPVSAVALNEAYFAWDGVRVTLQGYPDVMYGDSMVIENELGLVASPGERDELATFSFDQPQGIPVGREDLITVSGTIEYYWTGELNLVDGAMVDGPGPVEDVPSISPWALDAGTPVPVGDLHEVFNAWIGKEVTVEGYYHSTTTSTTDYGVTVRVDLAAPGDTYTKYVACEMAEEIPEGSDSLLVADRDGTRIRGTVAGESFGMVGLENCVLVNR